MPVGRISLNVHAQGVRDEEALLTFLRKIDPVAVLVMDGLGLCYKILGSLPQCIVIDREYPDGDTHFRMTPVAWLNDRATKSPAGINIWFYTTNEPGWSKELIDWHVALIKENAKRAVPIKMVIMNLSVGTPANVDDWWQAEELLRLCDKYREWCILGLHEYAAAVPTSGFIGGSPADRGFITNWPKGADMEKLFPPKSGMWHCGRVFFMENFCKTKGFTPPRVILTEHGFDALGDLTNWLNTLQKTSPYTSIGGWKSLENQWRQWFPARSKDGVLFDSVVYLNEELYKKSSVEAQLIFCWGWIDKQWEVFDVAGATAFQDYLADYVRNLLTTTPVTPPIQVPKPTNAGVAISGKITTESNVRKGNGTSYNVLYTTTIGTKILYYLDTIIWDSMKKYQWIWVEQEGKVGGWVALTSPLDVIFQPDPVPPPPQPTPIPPPEPTMGTLLPFAPFPDPKNLTSDEKEIVAQYLSWFWQVAKYVEENVRKGL